MAGTVTLRDRIMQLEAQARALHACVENESLRARIDRALLELERIPQLFPEPLAWRALLVPEGRLNRVREILEMKDGRASFVQ
jgi:hypothetical protein